MIKIKTRHFIGLITATLFVGCGGGTTDSSSTTGTNNTTPTSTSSTTTQCKQIESTLKSLNRKYASSKDDYDSYNSAYKTYKSSKGSNDSKGSSDSGGSHNEGKACLSCHGFASAGTVFKSLNAVNNTPGAAGHRIQLNGSIVYGSARGTGNSRTSSFPTGTYTAQVIDPNGNIVNSSASHSHDGSRRDCNRCHTATGNSGAPGRITSSKLSTSTVTPAESTTSTCVSFNNNVMPILESKCKNCHGSNGNFKITTANATHANITALKANKVASGTYLIDKGSNTIGHGGGNVISTSSAEYTTIKAWITEGTLNN